jgi:hypothetical protein
LYREQLTLSSVARKSLSSSMVASGTVALSTIALLLGIASTGQTRLHETSSEIVTRIAFWKRLAGQSFGYGSTTIRVMLQTE